MTAYERLCDALADRLSQTNGTRARARCPGHDGQSDDSLAITAIEGQTLLYCHAGCQTVDVLAAANLTTADLFDNPKGVTYRYDNGRTVHRTLNKEFWQANTKNTTPELYRLAKVKEAVAAGKPVFVVEGEKDVHALETLGVVATCNPMGASTWDKIDPSPLYGGKALIVADQDETGRKHAAQVFASLDGKADAAVFAPKAGKDAADHIAAGYGAGDFLPVEPGAAPADRAAALRARLVDADGLRLIPPPRPLVAGWLYHDSLAWLGGKPGGGKTFAAVDIACSVAIGKDWHGFTVGQGPVLYIIAEASAGLSPRVDAWALAHGARLDSSSIRFLPVAVQLLDKGDLTAVTTIALELKPVLIVIDTQARVTVGAEENSSKDMGLFVHALEQLREATHACILTAHHEPRNGEGLRGSIALEGAATTVIHAAKDGAIVELKNTKQKDAPEQPPLRLALSPISESAILSHEAVGLAGFTTSSEHHILTVLRDSFGTRGATKTELRDAASLPKTTWFRAIKALCDKGIVLQRQEGRSTIYTATADDGQQTVPTVPPSPNTAETPSPMSHTPLGVGQVGLRDSGLEGAP